MKKIILMLLAMTFIAFGYTAGVYAGGMEKSMGKDAGDVTAWIGKDVKNMEGEDLGDVSHFVRDEAGEEILLVIVSYEGIAEMEDKDIAVPFAVLSFNEAEDHVVLDATKEQLANAPAVEEGENLNDLVFAEEVYTYFGLRPHWTDEGADTQEGQYTQEQIWSDPWSGY